MPQHPVELSRVIYNPAAQAFEALAKVHDPAGARSYTCAIGAPITMDFPRAAEGLTRQALRHHQSGRTAFAMMRLSDAHPPLRSLKRLGAKALSRLRNVRKAA